MMIRIPRTNATLCGVSRFLMVSMIPDKPIAVDAGLQWTLEKEVFGQSRQAKQSLHNSEAQGLVLQKEI